MACLQPVQGGLGQAEALQGGAPVLQARGLGVHRQQPDPGLHRAARQLAEQRQGASIRRAARVAGQQQACGRAPGQALQQLAALFAIVQHAGVAHARWQGRRPGVGGVQLDAGQQMAVGRGVEGAGPGLGQGIRGGVLDAEPLAGRLQALAQQQVAGGIQGQAQPTQAGPPAPQAQEPEQQARQDAVHQQPAQQPAGPGLAGGLVGQRGVAAGADLGDVRQAETEQGGQRAEALGQGHEAVGAEQGGFPDEAVAAGGQHGQQQGQRAEQRQQPQAVDQRAQSPARQALAVQQEQQRRPQLRGLGVAGQLLAQPPQAAQGAAGVTGEQEAAQPAQQGEQVQAEQAAQRPEHVDRALAVAEGGEGQAGAAEQGQQEQRQQGQARALPPVTQGSQLTVPFGQQQGALLDALLQSRPGLAGAAVGLAILQQAGLLLAQADGFAQPESINT